MMKRNLCWIFREINKLIDEAVEEEDEAVGEEDKSVLARVGKFYSFLSFSFFLLTELIFFLNFKLNVHEESTLNRWSTTSRKFVR